MYTIFVCLKKYKKLTFKFSVDLSLHPTDCKFFKLLIKATHRVQRHIFHTNFKLVEFPLELMDSNFDQIWRE